MHCSYWRTASLRPKCSTCYAAHQRGPVQTNCRNSTKWSTPAWPTSQTLPWVMPPGGRLHCPSRWPRYTPRQRIPRQSAFAGYHDQRSGWLVTGLPTANLGTLLNNDTLRISVAKRLGAVVCVRHPCRCGKAMVEPDGRHGFSCIESAGRHTRHTAVNDLLARGLISADVPTKLKPPGLLRDDEKRPDGMTRGPFKRRQMMAWDAKCVDTMADSYIAQGLTRVRFAADEAERKQTKRYRHLEGTIIFHPVGLETFGPWGESAKEFITEIGRRITERRGEKAIIFLRQRISMKIERGNGILMLKTYAGGRLLDEIFYVLRLNASCCYLFYYLKCVFLVFVWKNF